MKYEIRIEGIRRRLPPGWSLTPAFLDFFALCRSHPRGALGWFAIKTDNPGRLCGADPGQMIVPFLRLFDGGFVGFWFAGGGAPAVVWFGSEVPCRLAVVLDLSQRPGVEHHRDPALVVEPVAGAVHLPAEHQAQNTASPAVKLTSFSATSYIHDIMPSSDGSLVAFGVGPDSDTQDLYVVTVQATPVVTKLTTTKGYVSDMKWFTADVLSVVYGQGSSSYQADLRVQPITGGSYVSLEATAAYTSPIMIW